MDVTDSGRPWGFWPTAAGQVALGLCASLLAWVLHQAGVPAPTLFGGLAAAVALGISDRWPLPMPAPSLRTAQGVIGVSVAVQLDASSLARVGGALTEIVLVAVATVALSVVAGLSLMLQKVDLVTAVFASIAGGAASISAMAKDFGADDRVVVVVQLFRVLIILTTLPFVAVIVFGADAMSTVRGPGLWADLEAGGVLLLVAVIVGGVTAGWVVRIPAGALLGPMILSLVLTSAGPSVPLSVPPLFLAVALLVLGAHAGLGFTRATITVLMRLFPMVVVIVGVVLVGSAGLGVWLSAVTDQTPLTGYLATSPGGLPVVLATAQSSQADVTFVSAVQVLRLLLTMAAMPLCVMGFRAWRRRRG